MGELAWFATIFRLSPVALGLSTIEEGRIIDVSDSWLELFGYEREEVIGRTNAELRLSVEPASRRAIVQAMRERGVLRNVEVQARRKSGEIVDLLISAVPFDLDGDADHWLSAALDITERKRAEAERDRLLGELRRAEDKEDPLAALTPRQREVLQLVAEGKTSKQIAALLGVRYRTVEAHRTQLMKRLGVHDLAGLVRLAVRVGLVAAETLFVPLGGGG